MGRSDEPSVAVGLHGSSGPGFDPSQYYVYRDGQMHNALVVVSFALVDQRPGDGGFAVVPGEQASIIYIYIIDPLYLARYLDISILSISLSIRNSNS